jgi:transcriptional regulator with XRE-family HTH domain
VYAGINPSTVNLIEHGHRNPNTRTLQKLADALEVEPGDFFKEPAPLGDAPEEELALAGKAGAPPSSPPKAADEERCAEYGLIRLWARWIESFHGRFVEGFVSGLPENPSADVLRENRVPLEQFASEFFEMGKALRESGVSELAMPYWNALLYSHIPHDDPGVQLFGYTPEGAQAVRREAEKLLEQVPEDVVRAMQDIRTAQTDVLQNLTKAVGWARRDAEVSELDYIEQYAAEFEKELGGAPLR